MGPLLSALRPGRAIPACLPCPCFGAAPLSKYRKSLAAGDFWTESAPAALSAPFPYGAFQPEPPVKKKNRTFKVLAIIVCCIFGASVLGFGGLGIYNLVTGKDPFAGFSSSSSAPSQPDNNDNHGIQGGTASAPPFQIGDTPSPPSRFPRTVS